ncbi:MAG TPA: NINE protein [Burkholderiaceae bacterium]|nr:NINE protein [Burkholderiaceae bacterium]
MQYAPEDRRLKVGGLIAAVIGFALIGWCIDQVERQWPPPPEMRAAMLAAAVVGGNLLAAGLLGMAAGFGTVRAWADPRRRRALGLQLLVANLVLPLLLVGGILDRHNLAEAAEPGLLEIGLTLLGYMLAVAAWALWRRSRRHDAPSATEAQAADPRPPVLYLRSFRDDGIALDNAESGVFARWLQRIVVLTTPEQECARSLQAVGPVIAIGKPGEPLPELGAARLYVGHEVWQAEVGALLARAGLVVLRVGSSPGVLWEIEQALARVPRERVVFAVLGDAPLAPEVAQRLAPVLGPSWSAALPEAPATVPWWTKLYRSHQLERRIGALICFPRAGPPCVVPVRRSESADWRERIRRPLQFWRRAQWPIRLAWDEVFARLGLAGQRVPGRSRAVAMLLALLLGWCGAHWWYLGRPRRAWLYLLAMPLLLVSAWLGWFDALRMAWFDRAQFERRYLPPVAAS